MAQKQIGTKDQIHIQGKMNPVIAGKIWKTSTLVHIKQNPINLASIILRNSLFSFHVHHHVFTIERGKKPATSSCGVMTLAFTLSNVAGCKGPIWQAFFCTGERSTLH